MSLPRVIILSVVTFAAMAISVQSRPGSATGADLSISGTVWEDLNADGARQPSENGVSVFLSLSTFTGLRTTRGGDDGHYSFEGVSPGSYVVRLSDTALFLTYPSRRTAPPTR